MLKGIGRYPQYHQKLCVSQLVMRGPATVLYPNIYCCTTGIDACDDGRNIFKHFLLNHC